MGIFGKDINCNSCGAKTNLFTRKKFIDDKFICGECASIIPKWVHHDNLEKWSFDVYSILRNHVEYSEKNLRPRFKKTHEYEKVLLDLDNGIFCIVDNFLREIKKDTIFFEVNKLLDYEFEFVPKEFKEGFFSDKVEGKTGFSFSLNSPIISGELILDSEAKAKAKKSLLGTKITYENPEKMANFESAFVMSIYMHMPYQDSETNDININSDKEDVELKNALALFMFDSLEEVSLEQLKAQRNRLIKVFHTDNNQDISSEFSVKINNAYSVLKSKIF